MRRVNWGGSLGLGLTVWLLVCGFLFQREQLDAPDVVSVKEYTGVEAAVTAIGTAPRTLLIPDVQTIAASITIPATLTLRFVSAGQLSINTGVMVTYLGSTADWPRRQIFTGPGATPGVIFTRSGETVRAYPQWWGAAGDGAADDTLPCQRAIDAVGQSGGGQVYFPAGTYIYIRTGQTYGVNRVTEPDAEINQVDAVDRGTGTLTVKWPLAKPYAQEYFIADASGETSTTPTAHPAVFGVANVTDRTITNVVIHNLNFQGPSDAPFFVGGQMVGLTVTNCTFTGRGGFSIGSYRRALFSHNTEHHTAPVHAAFLGMGATGTADVEVSENTLTGKGFVH